MAAAQGTYRDISLVYSEHIALTACFHCCSMHRLAGEVRPAQEGLSLQKVAGIPKLVFYDPVP